jgi:peptide/nickel transport system ATP-binding protein
MERLEEPKATGPRTHERDRASDQGEPLLQVEDLQTYFFTREGVVKAVDGASFNVYPGRTLGIVGESGCGKSIASKSILQILDSPGRIVGGQAIYNLREASGQYRRVDLLSLPAQSRQMRDVRGGEISMIFQEPMSSFSPVHTVGNQLIETIRLHSNVSEASARETALDWLRRVGISNPEQRMHDYPYRLSGGQCQRAMIAMALSTNPRILIADEPTTALDVTTQAQILNLLQDLQAEQGMSMIFITHDLGVIAEVADEVVVMYLGRVVERAPVQELFTNPQHPYTKALLTSIPSIDAQPRERLPSISGSIPNPLNRPTGCPFHPRCPAFMAGTCEVKEPQLTPVGDNHEASCFLFPGS